MKMDFICAGFAKCGTTTFDAILRNYKKINLPVMKEPRFFHWADKHDNPVERLFSEFYADIRPDQIVGLVDPAMTRGSVDELNKYFGNDVKIILMMRNPVKALFSDFKMGLRHYYWGYYWPFKKTTVCEKFEIFLDDCVNKRHDYKKLDLYKYDKYLEGVLNTFKKENVKVIFFEEFIKDPMSIKEEMEGFLGIDPEDVDYNIWVNEGSRVSRNYFCARINNYILQIKNKPNLKIKMAAGNFLRFVAKFTLVPNNEKITSELAKKCEDLYRESKDRVAALSGKDLNQLWFE